MGKKKTFALIRIEAPAIKMNISIESAGGIIKSIVGLTVSIICAVVIFFIIKFKNLREKRSNQLVLNLCIGHCLTGLAHFYGLFSTASTATRFIFSGYTYSTIALIFVSLDRFIYIRYPYRYEWKVFTRAHIGIMIVNPSVYVIYFVAGVISVIRKEKTIFAGT